ncbi:MAG: kelch repeat-containing protein [Planctomycetota bacterium]
MKPSHVYRLLVIGLPTAVLPAQFGWQQPGAAPLARAGHYAFFDAARGRTTVLGGQTGPTSYGDDVWQFDGASWFAMRTTAAARLPTPRSYGGACQCPGGGFLVFGGNETSGGLPPATLRWDANTTAFSALTPAVSPPPRWITAMVYDSLRNRVVLFGGGDAQGPLGDTWEFDGTNWTQRSPAQSPTPRANHVMAFDAVRGRTVLFGGHDFQSLNDTWEFDGTNWFYPTQFFNPSPRHNAMMAYDEQRGVTVLFGGKSDAGIVNNEVYQWNGTAWFVPSLPLSPAPRELGSLTYDRQRGNLVLVGGDDPATGSYQEVWALNALGWQQLAPAAISAVQPPNERTGHAAAYDVARGRTVVFGGRPSNPTVAFSDTLESDGYAFASRNPAAHPLGRYGAKMAYNPFAAQCYMFGGHGLSTLSDDLLWIWNGSAWSSTNGGGTPPQARTGHGLAYDTLRQRLVMFGGSTQFGIWNDTWEYSAATGWIARSPTTSPAGLTGVAMAYDSTQGLTYLYGGSTNTGARPTATWAWNGTNWAQVNATSTPPGLVDAAMCYDLNRHVLVLFGGTDGLNVSANVWEFDGSNWLPGSTSTQPPARSGASLVYETKSGRCVMFGGTDGATYFADCWEWEGFTHTWRARATVTPDRRRDHAMSYDPVRHRSVLFGGIFGGVFDSHTFDDTWEWDGTWHDNVPSSGPVGRSAMAAAYEAATARTVLFGGVSQSATVLADTWTWNGTTWTQQSVVAPPGRFNQAMVSLYPNPGVLMFGGHNGSIPLSDCYLWNGSNWLSAPGGPSARDIHAMAYDSLRQVVVLFGGRNINGSYLGDTWEYSVTTSSWSQRAPVVSPLARWNHAMAFDAARGRVVLTGGTGIGGYLDDVWEWDGTNWLQRAPETTAPSPLSNSTLVYDRNRHRSVFFGGDLVQQDSRELWELGAPIDLAGAGNTTHPQALHFYSQPGLGRTLQLGFANPQGLGAFALDFGPVRQPRLQFGGAPFCEATNIYATLASLLVLGSGEPNVQWQVPNSPLLLGMTLVAQGFAYEPGSCFRATDALHVVF